MTLFLARSTSKEGSLLIVTLCYVAAETTTASQLHISNIQCFAGFFLYFRAIKRNAIDMSMAKPFQQYVF
jgi:hypothetical protein